MYSKQNIKLVFIFWHKLYEKHSNWTGIKLRNKWNFMENETEIMQQVLKMQ
jgi:hypothetical protein